MVLLSILAFTAPISTYALFLVGFTICRTIAQKGSTEGISAVPFTACAVSCFFWLRYGMLKNDSTVINVNVVGLALQLVYIVFYYYYARNKKTINQQILFGLILCATMLAYINFVPKSESTAIGHLGMMCLTLNILNFAAPLAGLRDVFRTKTTESIPFYLCLASFIVGAQWFLYGVLVNDIYMKIPNFVGIILTLIQLSLFLIYPSKRRTAH